MIECRSPDVLRLPISGTDTVLVRDFSATTYCADDTTSKRSRASLTWRTNPRLLEKQRIDVTVYKRGFEAGTYAILWPLEAGQTFRDAERRLPNRPDNSMLFLTLIDRQTSADDRVMTVQLGGLHPGLNYFWRVLTLDAGSWTPGGFASASGPFCPEDFLLTDSAE